MKLGKSQRDKSEAEVASIAVVKDGALLWIRRADNALWTLPGGHLNPGEEPLDGALRELREETGLTPPESDIEFLGDDLVPGKAHLRIYCFVVEVPSDTKVDLSQDPDQEASDYEWKDELPESDHCHVSHGDNVMLKFLLEDDELSKAEQKEWRAKDGLKIPHHTTPARAEWDKAYHKKLVEFFGAGDSQRLKPVKIPITPQTSGTNPVVSKARFSLYTRMLAGGDRLPPAVVRRNGIGWHVVDGNHRLEAALKRGLKEMDAYELADPPKKLKKAEEDGLAHASAATDLFHQEHVKGRADEVPDCQHVATAVGHALRGLGHAVSVVVGGATGHEQRATPNGVHWWLKVDGKHFDPKGYLMHKYHQAPALAYRDYMPEDEMDTEAALDNSVEDAEGPASRILSQMTGVLTKSEEPLSKGEFRAAAFKHKDGTVVETGSHHNIEPWLQGGSMNHRTDGPWNSSDWEAGFVTHNGTFMNRDEAAKHVGLQAWSPVTGKPRNLDSQDPEAGLKKAEGPVDLVAATTESLDNSLRRPQYRSSPNPLAGHCYVASEALWHMMGGHESGWVPQNVKHEGDQHWYLRHAKTGQILDPTASQFRTPVPYDQGRGRGFLTKQPSKRAQEVINRVQAKLGKAEDLAKAGNPVTVYRLQNRRGEGPYDALGGEYMDTHFPDADDVSPEDDFESHQLDALHQSFPAPKFAFSHPDHAQKWFGTEGLSKLKTLGFELSPIQASKVEYSRSGKQVIFHPANLTKGLFSTAALAGAMALGQVGGAEQDPKPAKALVEATQRAGIAAEPVKWSALGLHQALIPIAHLESSFGQNIAHAKHPKGDYHTAHGALGFKPVTAHEEYLRAPTLQKLYGDMKDPAIFINKFKTDPKFYNLLATSHFMRLQKQHGSVERAAYAWRWGTGACQGASDEQVANEPYVMRYRSLAANAGLKKMAIKDIKPGTPIDETTYDYSHLIKSPALRRNYAMHVTHDPSAGQKPTDPHAREPRSIARVTIKHRQSGQLVGYVDGSWDRTESGHKAILPTYSVLRDKALRGKGLGKAMYEALYAHANNHLGIKHAVGEEHSTSASRVHQALAEKHGWDYQPQWGAKDQVVSRDFDGAFGPYEYKLT